VCRNLCCFKNSEKLLNAARKCKAGNVRLGCEYLRVVRVVRVIRVVGVVGVEGVIRVVRVGGVVRVVRVVRVVMVVRVIMVIRVIRVVGVVGVVGVIRVILPNCDSGFAVEFGATAFVIAFYLQALSDNPLDTAIKSKTLIKCKGVGGVVQQSLLAGYGRALSGLVVANSASFNFVLFQSLFSLIVELTNVNQAGKIKKYFSILAFQQLPLSQPYYR